MCEPEFRAVPKSEGLRIPTLVFTLFLSLQPALLAGGTEENALAFPTAEGYGRFSEGGRGGDVFIVTNLNDSGPGSLREGIVSMKGPRTIVFETGGTIELQSPLRIEKKSHLTIAGQTAPGGGICVKGYNVKFDKSSHIVVRHLRFRLGDQKEDVGGADSLTINNCDHVIFDHVSASWGIDGIQDIRECKHYTLQWSIFSEALNESLHAKGAHAMLGSFRAPLSNITIHHNLFSTSRDRHPTLGGSVKEPEWIVDFRNNVIYNWTATANVCDNGVNIVNNFFRPGPESDVSKRPIALKPDLPDKARGHMSGNVFEGREDFTADNYLAIDMERWLHSESKYQFDGTIEDWKVEEPYDLGENTPDTQSAKEAYGLVLANAGASSVRDAVDERVVQNVLDREGRVLNSQSEVGGWPDLDPGAPLPDQDRDGMPDSWESAKGLDPADPEDRNGDADKDGYTNLEIYLAERAGDIDASASSTTQPLGSE